MKKENTLIIIAVVGIIIFSLVATFNDKTYTITVTDKDRITTGGGDSIKSKYLVFGDDEAGNPLVFENTDNLLRWKFKSSNIQGGLKVGHTYDVRVIGFRIPIFSIYENIIDYYEITN